ncbi:mannosyltransferase family protein [Patulibacter sp. NPDC049589]|uniref:mannosyltransferase family protein n=1 Tax=Patulibacter sp. NPDC049589 TaxID=3154731 RepID=UPI0034170AA6
MGRHTQLERPAALEDLPASPAGPITAPATVAGAASRDAPLSWAETARVVLPAFVLTRVAVLVAGIAGAALWGIHTDEVYDPAGLTTGLGALTDRLVAPFARWDAVWFLDIANHGYPTSYLPRTAFFPLYPGLLRAGSVVGSPLLAGLLISTVCAYGGAMLLHRMTELELGRRAARASVWVLLVFPGSLWLTAVYSEGLFLLISVGCLYAARERQWMVVAVLGALAATTRSAGIVLVVPILVIAWQQQTGRSGPSPRALGVAALAGVVLLSLAAQLPWVVLLVPALAAAAYVLQRGPRTADADALERPRLLDPDRLRALSGPAAAAAMVAVGLLTFLVGLRLAGHTWTVSFDQQQEWGRRNVGPIDGVVRSGRSAVDGLEQLFGPKVSPAIITPNAEWMNPLLLVFLVLGLAALVGVARRLPPAYAAYAGCALLLPLSAPVVSTGGEPLMSLPRFLGVLFPLAMWAGWWLTRGRWQRTRMVVLGVVGIGLLMLVTELTTRWVFVA